MDFKRQKPNDFFHPPLNPLPRGDFSNSHLERGKGCVNGIRKNFEIPIHSVKSEPVKEFGELTSADTVLIVPVTVKINTIEIRSYLVERRGF